MIVRIFFAILLFVFLQAPFIVLFINERKQKQYREILQNTTVPDCGKFEMPPKLWLWTFNGILTSCLLFFFFLSLALAITRIYFKHVYLPEVIMVFALTWISLAVIMPLMLFEEHKKDYFFIGVDKVDCKRGSKFFSIPRNKLRIVEKKSYYLLYSGSNKKLRIHKNTIRGFVSGEILQKRLRELIEK